MIVKLILAQERQYRGKGDWHRLVLKSVDVGRQCQREEARIQYILEGREEGTVRGPHLQGSGAV